MQANPAPPCQNDSFDDTASITICSFTMNEREAPLFRLPIEPDSRNGLDALSRIMVDKITTVPKQKIGELGGEDIARLDRAVTTFLGLAASQGIMC